MFPSKSEARSLERNHQRDEMFLLSYKRLKSEEFSVNEII